MKRWSWTKGETANDKPDTILIEWDWVTVDLDLVTYVSRRISEHSSTLYVLYAQHSTHHMAGQWRRGLVRTLSCWWRNRRRLLCSALCFLIARGGQGLVFWHHSGMTEDGISSNTDMNTGLKDFSGWRQQAASRYPNVHSCDVGMIVVIIVNIDRTQKREEDEGWRWRMKVEGYRGLSFPSLPFQVVYLPCLLLMMMMFIL